MRRLVLFLGLLWLGAPPLPAQAGGAPAARVAPAELAWSELLARDARVGFSPRTALAAGEVLRDEKARKEQRASAWLALGSVGAGEWKAQLLEAAKKADEPERSAAVLALGELGTGGSALLQELARGADPALADVALLALLRTRDPALRRGVEETARDARDPRSALASKLLVFTANPAAAEESAPARLLFELRWRAAREFGLIDGKTWRVLVYESLGAREEFRSEVVLRAAAGIDRPGVHDLLLGALLHGQGPGRLRAAARGIPRELAQLVQNGLWKPADLGEWRTLFDALEAERLESYAPELFEAALAEPALAARALDLYSRSGAQDLGPEIDARLAKASAADRVYLCRAMGESEDPGYLARLGPLAASGEPAVRAAALVAELLLGSRPAEAALRSALAEPEGALRPALLVELAANARSASALVLLEAEFAEAKEDERRPLALALAREGVRDARTWCREALLAEPGPGPEEALALLGALRSRLSSEDTAVLRGLFPREDTPAMFALNVELALSLAEIGDSIVHPLLHVALWQSSFEVSVLAGALVAQGSGLHALRGEAANPPAEARSGDLRRVGYALGTWGGLPEVEALARVLRYNSGAPALQGVLLGFLSTRTQ